MSKRAIGAMFLLACAALSGASFAEPPLGSVILPGRLDIQIIEDSTPERCAMELFTKGRGPAYIGCISLPSPRDTPGRDLVSEYRAALSESGWRPETDDLDDLVRPSAGDDCVQRLTLMVVQPGGTMAELASRLPDVDWNKWEQRGIDLDEPLGGSIAFVLFPGVYCGDEHQ